MKKSLLAALSLMALAACGGGEEARAPANDAPAAELAVTDFAGANLWVVDREASMIGFVASQNQREFEGSFGRWDASILLNPEDPEAEGQLEAVVDLSSVDAGSRDRNEALPEEGWFNTALHPTATYRSTGITAIDGENYVAEGTLTIKGVTQPVTMPFTLRITEDGRAIADGSVELDRSQFGIGQGEFADDRWVGFGVEVRLHMEATPAE